MTLAEDTRVESLEVLDPVAPIAKNHVPPAPRISDLSGRKIGLYWNTKAGGDIGLEEAARLLSTRFQDLKFEKFTYNNPAPKGAVEKVVQAGPDAIIGATGD
ncbi:MAG: hypothetical protein HYX92_16600 [Chloroflexi bacterium]|nr:hypothetical protein [Chloroflexota bacterium]